MEQAGLPNAFLIYGFIVFTIVLYTGIGLLSRTTDISAYYVANREVPALFNGMATAADWMSAASFLGLSGTIYLMGFDGLAYILGWTGGFVLVAMLVAPYMRRFGQFTVTEFVGARYGAEHTSLPRLIAVIATALFSFVYLVAQIYGVGLITSRFTGLEFGIGVFFGLAGILLCSFLGGMRAVTWTQVAQCIIMVVTFILPISLLSAKLTGNPVHVVAYQDLLDDIAVMERRIRFDPDEIEVRNLHATKAIELKEKINRLPTSWADGIEQRTLALENARRRGASFAEIKRAERQLREFPQTAELARQAWGAELEHYRNRMQVQASHVEPFDGGADNSIKRRNFMALMFSLMIGTAALPHLLTRFLTTTGVGSARLSVVWALFFICLVYLSAPALATFVKYLVFRDLVGASFNALPGWLESWRGVDRSLIDLKDLNGDGRVQLAELVIGADIITLAAPEIAGLPYFITGLVATGGLAAALSTADGLLLTIANSMSHDLYYRMLDREATTQKRVTISKIILFAVAMSAAWLASTKPGNILFLVGAAFSLAGSALFPMLVAGVFWRRANWQGAVAGMLTGLLVCVVYMAGCYMPLMMSLGMTPWRWFGIEPVSAAVFGVPAGVLALCLVTLCTAPPSRSELTVLERVRTPRPE
jgi:cation/acetate symporter